MIEISAMVKQRGKEPHENIMSMDEMFQKAREARTRV